MSFSVSLYWSPMQQWATFSLAVNRYSYTTDLCQCFIKNQPWSLKSGLWTSVYWKCKLQQELLLDVYCNRLLLLLKVPLVLQAFTKGTQWSWQESNSSSPSRKSKKTNPAVLKDTALLGSWDNELTRADFSLPLFSKIVSNKIWQAEKPLLRGETKRQGWNSSCQFKKAEFCIYTICPFLFSLTHGKILNIGQECRNVSGVWSPQKSKRRLHSRKK